MPVSVATAESADVPVDWRGVGNVEALSNVAVRSQVGGTLFGVHFREGDEVRKGDLLFTIDPRQFEAALHTAEARLARDQALAENSAATAARYAELAQKEFVTAEEYETKRSTAAALNATLAASRAEVERARLDLGYCRIVAPISGRTGSLNQFAGNLVKANDDQPLVVIQQVAPIRVASS
jgi:multidrug efflux system membrane fusion protein